MSAAATIPPDVLRGIYKSAVALRHEDALADARLDVWHALDAALDGNPQLPEWRAAHAFSDGSTCDVLVLRDTWGFAGTVQQPAASSQAVYLDVRGVHGVRGDMERFTITVERVWSGLEDRDVYVHAMLSAEQPGDRPGASKYGRVVRDAFRQFFPEGIVVCDEEPM